MHIATKSSKIDISLENNTRLISNEVSQYLKKGDIFFLYGEIGVGKSTFIKYLINFLQSKSNLKQTEVPSPTFNIVNEYKTKDFIIQHYDLFRINDHRELQNIGLFENNKDLVTFIEWPEIIKEKPKKRIELLFSYEGDFKKRSLVISSDFRKEIVDEFK